MELVGSQKIVTLPEGKLTCPADGALIRLSTHKQIELDIGPTCAPLWLDAGELQKVTAKKAPSSTTDATTSTWSIADADMPEGTFVGEAIDGVVSIIVDSLTD